MDFNEVLKRTKKRREEAGKINTDNFYKQYRNYLNTVYGAFEAVKKDTSEVMDEIVHLECDVFYFNITSLPDVSTVYKLIQRYSDMAFCMARARYFDDTVFITADVFSDVINKLYNSDHLTPDEKMRLRKLVSETVLDFAYAGSDNKTRACSFRMSSIIQHGGD